MYLFLCCVYVFYVYLSWCMSKSTGLPATIFDVSSPPLFFLWLKKTESQHLGFLNPTFGNETYPYISHVFSKETLSLKHQKEYLKRVLNWLRYLQSTVDSQNHLEDPLLCLCRFGPTAFCHFFWWEKCCKFRHSFFGGGWCPYHPLPL